MLDTLITLAAGMDVEYLSRMGVTDAVTRGVAHVLKQQHPDPVHALGTWLLDLAAKLESKSAVRVEGASLRSVPVTFVSHLSPFARMHAIHFSMQTASAAERDAANAASRQSTELITQQKAGALAAAKAARAVKLEALLKHLETCVEIDATTYATVLTSLKELTDAAGAYICEGHGVGLTDTDDAEAAAAAAAASRIRYVAATSDHAWLKECAIKGGSGGVLWKLWDAPPLPEGEEGVEAPLPAPLSPSYIPSVLAQPGVVFHRLPRPGAFLAVPLTYPQILHEGALMSEGEEEEAEAQRAAAAEEAAAALTAEVEEATAAAAAAAEAATEAEAAEAEDGESAEGTAAEAKEVAAAAAAALTEVEAKVAAAAAAAAVAIAPLPSKPAPRHLAVCLDTVDSGAANVARPPRGLSSDAQAAAVRVAGALRAALLRTEAEAFKEEHEAVVKARADGRKKDVAKGDAAILKGECANRLEVI